MGKRNRRPRRKAVWIIKKIDMKEFDFYEITGVIAPGMALIVGAVLLFFPDQQHSILSIANISMGSFGVGLILSYIAGQLLQAVGNGLETVWWRLWGGMPTDWVRSAKHDLIATHQRELVQDRVQKMMCSQDFAYSSVDAKQWYSITRQVYAAVSSAERGKRVDKFNGNYGQHRGLAAGFLVLLVSSTVLAYQPWKVCAVLAILTALAIYRMHRFGKLYGRELFIQFLELPGDMWKTKGQ